MEPISIRSIGDAFTVLLDEMWTMRSFIHKFCSIFFSVQINFYGSWIRFVQKIHWFISVKSRGSIYRSFLASFNIQKSISMSRCDVVGTTRQDLLPKNLFVKLSHRLVIAEISESTKQGPAIKFDEITFSKTLQVKPKKKITKPIF